MKRLLLLLVCVSLLGMTTGCCWLHGPYGYGGCYGGQCSPGSYGGYAPLSQGAYSGSTSITAGVPITTPYAMAPIYPTTAALPINSLPTY